MTNRSMRMVKRPGGSAQGTWTWRTPCSLQFTRGTRAWTSVWNWQVFRCRQVLPGHDPSIIILGRTSGSATNSQNHARGRYGRLGFPPQAAHPPLSMGRIEPGSSDKASCCLPLGSPKGKVKSIQLPPTKLPEGPYFFPMIRNCVEKKPGKIHKAMRSNDLPTQGKYLDIGKTPCPQASILEYPAS